jgi:exopolysaccharide biosynthesis polyprenyl glycosylphosphotransferase
MEIQKNKIPFRILLIIVDLALINLGYIMAFLLKFRGDVPEGNFISYLTIWPWLTISALALFYFYQLYGSYRWRWTEVFASLICVVFFQALIAMALSFFLRGFTFPRTVLLTAPLIHIVILSIWRRIAWNIERYLQNTRKIIVVGQPLEAVVLAEKLESLIGGKIKVDGLVVNDIKDQELYQSGCFEDAVGTGKSLYITLGGWPILGDVSGICECLDAVKPDQVFVCSNLQQEYKAEVVYACVAKDIKVYLVPDLYEIMLAQARLDQVDDVPVFAVGRLSIPEESLAVKRISDIFLALAALLITSPLIIFASIAIRLDSPGPIFYRQKRLTLQGKPFNLYKFRTMVEDAEQESGPVLAAVDDPRVTRVGRFLRATRFDEVPQLLNVLKGDMSIVGPRPERPFFVSKLVKETPEYAFRMNVKSGITGLAQIAGRYSTSAENKLKYDLLYTKSYSPARDLAILLQTVKVILLKDKAS